MQLFGKQKDEGKGAEETIKQAMKEEDRKKAEKQKKKNGPAPLELLNKTYKVGISTGWWRVARAADLLGMAAKIAYGATAGVQFVQIDLETTSEFFEPELKYQVDRVRKELGIEVGLHGEIGEIMALESSELRIWDQSHRRLCETMKRAADMKFTFVNFHLSTKPQLLYEESRYRIQGYFYPVVSYDGRPLWTITDASQKAKELAVHELDVSGQKAVEEVSYMIDDLVKKYNEKLRKESEALRKRVEDSINNDPNFAQMPEKNRKAHIERLYTEQHQVLENTIQNQFETERRSREFKYRAWKASEYGQYIIDNSEVGAYLIMATYMRETGDSLWANIAGGGEPWHVYTHDQKAFNAAVGCKYIEGHLTVKGNKWNKEHLGGKSVKEFCEEKNIIITFEVPEGPEGQEGLYRLFDPRDSYHLLKKIGSPFVRQCIDFEHMLSHKLDPEKIIKDLPSDAGSYVFLFHVGRPIPYFGTAHIPIPLGSQAMEVLYKWIWAFKQKGFEKGWIIYERGGGNTPLEVLQQSVQAVRQIADYLERGTPPDELPLAFYGVAEQNEEIYKRQLVTVIDNAWKPITGLLQVPEFEHTFLSTAAVQRGKAEEWKKGRYR